MRSTKRRILSMTLILAMTLTLFNLPAYGMELTLSSDKVTVAAENGNRAFLASYDGGRFSALSSGEAEWVEGRAVRVMELDENSSVPKSAAITLSQSDGGVQLSGGTVNNLNVSEGTTVVLTEDITLTGYNRVDGTLTVPRGVTLTVAAGGELFIRDADGFNGRIALGGTLMPLGNLNVGDFNRRIVGCGSADGSAQWGKFYNYANLDEVARIVGEVFAGKQTLPGDASWQATDGGKQVLARLLNGTECESVEALDQALAENSNDGFKAQARQRVSGFDLLWGSKAITEDMLTPFQKVLSEAELSSVLKGVWTAAMETAAPEPVFTDATEPFADMNNCRMYGVAHRAGGDESWWESSFSNDVSSYFYQIINAALSGVKTIAVGKDDNGVFARLDGGETKVYGHELRDATFAGSVSLTFEESARDEWFNFERCMFVGDLTITAPSQYHVNVNFCDNCTMAEGKAVKVSLPDGVAPENMRERLDLNGLNGLAVASGAPVNLHGGSGAVFTVLQTGESDPVTVQSGERCDVSLEWWTEESDKVCRGMSVHNFIYQYNEEEERDVNTGASQVVTSLSGKYQGDGLNLGGNLDVSGLEVTGRLGVFNNENHPSTIRFGANTVTLDQNNNDSCALIGTGTVILERTHYNGGITVNGTPVGEAHVFCPDMPFGVYLGQAAYYGENAGYVDQLKLYAGHWDNDSQQPTFGNAFAENSYEYEDNGSGGVNLQKKEQVDDWNWIGDPWQVKLELTLRGCENDAPTDTTATVIYNTLWYKEGQMPLAEFVSDVRDVLGGSELAAVTDTDRAEAAEIWESGRDYNEDSLDQLAFARKYVPGMGRPGEGNEEDEKHYWSVWDDVRYGTAKILFKNLLRAAWNDQGKELPASIKLMDENGNEYHQLRDTINHNEIYRMIDAFVNELPRENVDGDVTITLISEQDYRMKIGQGDEEPCGGNVLSGKEFSGAVTVINNMEPRGEDDDYGGEFVFRNCVFHNGVTIYRNARSGIDFDFKDSCTGAITVAVGDDIEADEYGDNGKWVTLRGIDGMSVTSQTNSVNLDGFDRRSATVNGLKINVTEDIGVDIFADANEVRIAADRRWDEQGNPIAPVVVTNVLDESGNAVVYTGSLRVAGGVDVSDLSRTGQLSLWQYADNWRGVWRTESFIKLGANLIVIPETDWIDGYDREYEGDQEFVTDGGMILLCGARSWRMNLTVNGQRLDERPVIRWHEGETDEQRFWALYYPEELTVAQLGYLNDEGGHDWLYWPGHDELENPITLTPEQDNRMNYVTGEWLVDDGNNPVGNLSVCFNGGTQEESNRFALVYDPALRDFEAPVSIGELGEHVLRLLEERDFNKARIAGMTVEDYLAENVPDEIDARALKLFNAIWQREEENGWDNWADPSWRLRTSFVLNVLMSSGDTAQSLRERYGDPGNDIRYGDALTVLAAAWNAAGKTGALPGSVALYLYDDNGERIGPRSGEALAWGFSRGEKDELVDRLRRALDNEYDVSTVEELVAALSSGGRAFINTDMELTAEALSTLAQKYENVLTVANGSRVTLTVPADAELRVCYGSDVTVGENVTVQLADGEPTLSAGAEELTAATLAWGTNEWNEREHYVLTSRAELCVNDGTLTVNEGGAIVAGHWADVRTDPDGTLIVNGTMTLAEGDFHATGYLTNGKFEESDWDDNKDGEDWQDISNAPHLDNNGTLTIHGTLTIGKYASLQNNRIDDRPQLGSVEVYGTVTVAKEGYIGNGNLFGIEPGGTLTIIGGFGNNLDDRGTEDGEDDHSALLSVVGTLNIDGDGYLVSNAGILVGVDFEDKDSLGGTLNVKNGYFESTGTLSVGTQGALTVEADGNARIRSTNPYAVNGLTVTPHESGSEAFIAYEEDGTLFVSNDGATLTLSAESWEGELNVYGDVDASGVNGGAVHVRTVFVKSESDLLAVMEREDAADIEIIVAESFSLFEDLTVHANQYLEIGDGATLTVPQSITLTFADGSALTVGGQLTGELIDLSAMRWGRRMGTDSMVLRNTGDYVRIAEGGKLQVDGTLVLGRFGYFENEGTLTVNGTMTLKDATFFQNGKVTGANLGEGVGEEGDDYIATDCATLINNGLLELSGSLTVGANGYLCNNHTLSVEGEGHLTNNGGMMESFGFANLRGTLTNNGASANHGFMLLDGTWTIGTDAGITSDDTLIVYAYEKEDGTFQNPDLSGVSGAFLCAVVETANGLINAGASDSGFIYCDVIEDVTLTVTERTSLYIPKLSVVGGKTLTLDGPVVLTYDELNLGLETESEQGTIKTVNGATHGPRQ